MNQTQRQEATESKSAKPTWIRLPKNGSREYWSGLSRSALNLLVLPCEQNGFRAPVYSISLRKKGRTRGNRLILLESDPGDSRKGLLNYLATQDGGHQ